ncbi:tipN [Brevundimonas sp.]
MKSRQRPPLNLSSLEPIEPDQHEADQSVVEPSDDPSLEIDRPMSERRRRRLAEEQTRQAQARADALIQAEHDATAEVVVPSMAAPTTSSAEATLAPYEAPAVPAPVRARKSAPPSEGRAYLIAGLASAAWVAGVAAWLTFEVTAGAAELEPLRLAVYALIALAPVGLAIMLAHAVRQGAGLAAETRRARELAEALVAPTALAAQQTGTVLQSLRNDIDLASVAAERARHDMTLLREALVQETTRLTDAADVAGRTARRLVEQLGAERTEMQALGTRLDAQATGVADAVERQSRMVIDASDLAQTQLREAEAALAARAADLAAAAGEAQDAARVAADDLARQTLRLENAGAGVAEQILSVEEGLGQQRAALVTAALGLRTDQEDFSAQVESQRAQLTEQLSATRSVTQDLGDTTQRTTESIKDLVEAATDQFRALVNMSQREADGFDAATKLALDKFEGLAAEARDALVEETRRALAALQATAEDSRQAATEAADLAQVRVDRLGEALFEAAQKADHAADTRIDGARKIVAETAGMVDEAGERALMRLESTVERMNDALARIDASIGDLDDRTARLPEEAQARVDAVRTSVEQGLAALSAASQKAAADTEALDLGFQERVRRNYDMLTEAVRLMGVVSGEPAGGRRRDAVASAPAPVVEPSPTPESALRPALPAKDEVRGFGLRSRLKLEPAPPPSPKAASDVDWIDLDGASPDDEEPLDLDTPVMPVAESEALGGRITAAIRRMGVDPNALLPRSRVEEAAQAITNGDPDRARQIVRRVAPAAVRSVSRRVLTDPDMRADAEAYVRAFSSNLAERAAARDGAAVLGQLTSDGGRAYMLLDAAIGDLG